MNNIDELIERLVIAKNRLVELDEEAKDRDDNATITLAITALREQQELIAKLEWCAEIIDEANSKGLSDDLASHFHNMSGDPLTADELDLYHKVQALEVMSVKAERQLAAALEENKNLCEQIAELESTVEAYRENRAGQYKRQRDAALADLDELRDRLKNGIKYDEELNCYVVVWTEREIENARRQADEISKRIRGMK